MPRHAKMTFQFDTAFMFVFSGLIVVVMYDGIQLNHARKTGGHVGASKFYLGFIVPLYILNYLGSLNHSKEGLIPTAAWATPLALWLFFIFNWVGYKLYLENWCLLIFWRWVRSKYCCQCCTDSLDPNSYSLHDMKKCKFFCLITGLIVAVLLFCLFSVVKFIGSLPHALLFTCITESVIVICWNLCKCGSWCDLGSKKNCWKLCECCSWCDLGLKKKIGVIAYLFTNFAFGISALVFFIGFPTTDKAETPQISRNKNHKCIMLDFYDYHDLWHILSSFALLMGVHIVIFACYDPDTISDYETVAWEAN